MKNSEFLVLMDAVLHIPFTGKVCMCVCVRTHVLIAQLKMLGFLLRGSLNGHGGTVTKICPTSLE